MLLVLLDDVGFGAGSAFGGPCDMPTAERMAGQGLKHTRFRYGSSAQRVLNIAVR